MESLSCHWHWDCEHVAAGGRASGPHAPQEPQRVSNAEEDISRDLCLPQTLGGDSANLAVGPRAPAAALNRVGSYQVGAGHLTH